MRRGCFLDRSSSSKRNHSGFMESLSWCVSCLSFLVEFIIIKVDKNAGAMAKTAVAV